MKRYLLFSLCILFYGALASQEAFYIENYHVDILLHTNGSFDVTETIDVHFTEERRGIIRDIPCRYTFDTIKTADENRYAFGANSSGEYTILIDSIKVKDYNFSVSDYAYNKRIKIGSADKYITGKHQYVIKYTVWGAINEFIEHSEFSWNVIGTEWKTDIVKASFSLIFEDATKLSKKAVKIFSGALGSRENKVSYSISEREITGKMADTLKPGEGITLLVKLPWNYFNNRYKIQKHTATIYLEKDGSFDIKNSQKLKYRGYQQYVLNRLPKSIKSPIRKKHQLRVLKSAWFDSTENQVIWVHGVRGTEDSYKNEALTRSFRYTVTNGKTEFKNGEGLLWKWDLSYFQQKVDTFEINLELLKFANPVSISLTRNNKPVKYNLKDRNLIAKITNLKRNDIILLKVVYPKWTYTKPLKKHIIYDYRSSFVVAKFEDDIFINNDATVKLKRKYYVDFTDEIQTGEYFPFSVQVTQNTGYGYYFYNRSNFIIENVEANNAEYYREVDGFKLDWGKNDKPALKSEVFEFEYTTYNMLSGVGDDFAMNIPIYEDSNWAVVSGTLQIHFPENIKKDELDYLLSSSSDYTNYHIIESTANDSILKLEFELDKSAWRIKKTPYLHLQFPKGNIKTSFSKDAKIFYDKYDDEIEMLFIPLIITFVLFWLWFFIGRDKKQEIEEKHYIPENISPPEVGYIWDGKLHKRDLVALIYHWAAKGYLKISDMYSGSENITLTKVKSLPKNSKTFEHTIFDGLFNNAKEVKVSSLRDSFYSTMNLASLQFKNYRWTKKMIMPGTKAFGRVLIVLGIIVGFIFLLAGLIDEDVFVLTYALLLSAPFIFFGIIMPKYGQLGAKLHREVMGFKKFIERSEVDRLMMVLEENPDYFDQTIAYAIVMGMGKTWAKKFKGLIKVKAEAAKSGEGEMLNIQNTNLNEELDTLSYFNNIIKRMHKIEDDFHYRKPPKRSYSSSYSSSSSSSYSYKSSSSYSGYSSSSGGSSSYGSSSGGGYSGSGYGGGGGSSW